MKYNKLPLFTYHISSLLVIKFKYTLKNQLISKQIARKDNVISNKYEIIYEHLSNIVPFTTRIRKKIIE